MPLSLWTAAVLAAAGGRHAKADERNAACRTPLELPEGDIPLYIRWEEYVPTFLATVEGVSFVQVGANCGLNSRQCAVGGDPVFAYARACRWHGIAIEPVKRTYEALVANYATTTPLVRPMQALISHTRLDNSTVVAMGETSTAYDASDPKQRRSIQKFLAASLKRSSTAAGSSASRKRPAHPELERVPQRTLADVWPDGGATVLVVDAEGNEPSILGSHSLPWPLPQLILFEHFHLSDAQRERVDVQLRRQGFEHIADLKHRDQGALRLNMTAQDRLYGRRRRSM